MSGTIKGVDPNSGLSFSYGVNDPAAPVNTASQNLSAFSAAAGFAGAVAGVVGNPNPLTALGVAGAGANAASKLGDMTQGLADLGNQVGFGPAQNVGGYNANMIEVGMMEGEANPLPAGTITGTDVGDPSPPSAGPGVITSPGIQGFLVSTPGGGFLHLDPGEQQDGALSDG